MEGQGAFTCLLDSKCCWQCLSSPFAGRPVRKPLLVTYLIAMTRSNLKGLFWLTVSETRNPCGRNLRQLGRLYLQSESGDECSSGFLLFMPSGVPALRYTVWWASFFDYSNLVIGGEQRLVSLVIIGPTKLAVSTISKTFVVCYMLIVNYKHQQRKLELGTFEWCLILMNYQNLWKYHLRDSTCIGDNF